MIEDAQLPRVALFTDSYAEANGVATLSRALEEHARRHDAPYLCVHGGTVTELSRHGSTERLELRRGPAAFRLEHDLAFDPLLWRHYRRARQAVAAFRPDVVHITGPSDVGQLGTLLAHQLHIPIVGSWHTNIHQYAAARSSRWCGWLPRRAQAGLLGVIERGALAATLLFYRVPRVLMAPNEELVELIARRTGKRVHLMDHGVDTETFSCDRRVVHEGRVRIGFVGRLSAEKQVHLLVTLARAFESAGETSVQFVIVGDGAERGRLQQEMPAAEFTGVLRGEALAGAFASFDLFAFPSRSETFGLAVLEAMASGVPVLAMAEGGPRFVVEHGVSGWLAGNEQEFVDGGLMLVRDQPLREALGAAARVAAERRSWSAVCDRLYDVYEEARTPFSYGATDAHACTATPTANANSANGITAARP